MMSVSTETNGSTEYQDYELYVEAVAWAEEEVRGGRVEANKLTWWAAWFAARGTASVLLETARKVGVNDEQWEALRKVAARVATD